MVNVYEAGSNETLNFEQSLKTMDDSQLNELKRDLKSKDTPEADSQLALVLKEMDERKREKETGSREVSMEAKVVALNAWIQEIKDEYEKKKWKIDKSTPEWKAQYQALLKEEAAAIKLKIETFAHTDVRSFEGSKRSIEETKTAEIQRLTSLLEEKPSVTNAIKDTLSPSSLKLQKVDKDIQKLRDDRANYPGNMLRYLAGVTTSYFMTPFQRAKRGLQSVSKYWKSDEELWKRFDAIKDILQENSSDSAWRRNLKQKLRAELVAAQTEFVNNARNRAKKQVGLAA